ncbi:hypothetical protein JEQ12_019334 [Ovis aries]|uniref:(2E,6E)-farnesyl diphosphate synthase n=1 Tax=Ovis aries TaxID=9940 RepID=A0A836A175_SHEEP|nr:hypothetical protein JEQ12_019334 [Ovis aries]
MYMAGIDGEKENANAKKILPETGGFFQIQDDYLDLFGDPSVTDAREVIEIKLAELETGSMLHESFFRRECNKVQCTVLTYRFSLVTVSSSKGPGPSLCRY